MARTSCATFRVGGGRSLRSDVVDAVLREAAASLGGVDFLETSNFLLLSFDERAQTGVLSILEKHRWMLGALVASVRTLHGEPISIRILL